MNARNISLVLAGSIWLAVALRIGNRALTWMQPYFDNFSLQAFDWRLLLILVSIAIGIAKSNTVLRKAALRNIGNSSQLANGITDYIFGWLKLFGIKGSIVISLMIALGFGLRALRDMGCDPFNLFGFLYLGVALALLLSARFYFEALGQEQG